MSEVTITGINLAKPVLHLYATHGDGTVVVRLSPMMPPVSGPIIKAVARK